MGKVLEIKYLPDTFFKQLHAEILFHVLWFHFACEPYFYLNEYKEDSHA